MWVQHTTTDVITPQPHAQPKQKEQSDTTPIPQKEKPATAQAEKARTFPQALRTTKLVQNVEFSPDKQNNLSAYKGKTQRQPAPSLLFTEEIEESTHPTKTKPLKNTSSINNIPTLQKSTQEPLSHKNKLQTKTLLFLAMFYCFGLVLSGVLYQSFGENERILLQYYLQDIVSLFNTDQTSSILISHLRTSVFALSSIFLFGLSAIGLPLILIFLLLKGFENGILLLSFLLQSVSTATISYLALFTVLETLLACCLCLLSVTASRNAHQLFQYVFKAQLAEKTMETSTFFKHYIFLLVFMILSCFIFAIGLAILA